MIVSLISPLVRAVAPLAILAVLFGVAFADENPVEPYDQASAVAAGLRPVTANFAVAPQIDIADLSRIAEAGFTRIINHRPDGEGVTQPLSADFAKEAKRLGLKFVNLPFRPGHITPEVFDGLTSEWAASNEPTLAYCRSGTRAITLWARSEVSAGHITPAQAIAAADSAGYNLQSQRSVLEQLAKVKN